MKRGLTYLAAVAAVAFPLSVTRAGETASVEGVAQRGVQGAEHNTVGIARGFQDGYKTLTEGQGAEKALAPVDSSARWVWEGSGAVVDYSAGLTDIPGAVANAGLGLAGRDALVPSTGPAYDSVASKVGNAARNIYGAATGWLRSSD